MGGPSGRRRDARNAMNAMPWTHSCMRADSSRAHLLRVRACSSSELLSHTRLPHAHPTLAPRSTTLGVWAPLAPSSGRPSPGSFALRCTVTGYSRGAIASKQRARARADRTAEAGALSTPAVCAKPGCRAPPAPRILAVKRTDKSTIHSAVPCRVESEVQSARPLFIPPPRERIMNLPPPRTRISLLPAPLWQPSFLPRSCVSSRCAPTSSVCKRPSKTDRTSAPSDRAAACMRAHLCARGRGLLICRGSIGLPFLSQLARPLRRAMRRLSRASPAARDASKSWGVVRRHDGLWRVESPPRHAFAGRGGTTAARATLGGRPRAR